MKEVLTIKNYIGGEWVESKSDRILDVINPANQKVLAKVPVSTREEIDEAVEAAKEAFPMWRNTTPVARVRYLFRLRELMEEQFEELSRIQTMEHGKTIDESRGETRRGIEMVETATGITSLMQGYLLEDIAVGIDEFAYRQPLGVFGIIGPFNFPFMVPLWFIPFALACGNCVVVKPSSEDPISQMKIAELAEEVGIPPGVWNVVNGGRDVVTGMLEHPDIEGICFVGSTRVGRDVIYKKCGETGKRCIAQCGAKNFLLVMPDANLDRTIRSCMTSFYGNTGQRCLSGANLVIVGEGLNEHEFNAFYDKVVNAFVKSASQIRVGYGLDETVQMGPLRDVEKKKRLVKTIQKGIDEGAKLLLDGRNIKLVGDLPQDAFLNPSVFTEVTPDMYIGKEELFGPIACIMRAKNLEEAIDMIHSNPYGNATSIFTQNGKWARQFIHEVKAGNVGINIGIVAPMSFFPFAGMKDSFYGVLHGQRESIDFFTDRKVVIQRWF
ncbi:methylmalonate-semialdehyde dehydrogenase (CoA acylating) [Candidatus Bathyarchaeota archaeon]|nr:MAG: methylmalonate-semialdehyde dehydrogenase (CoA acylating) [Candidatus Bathyarchaeota archaeon]